MNAADFGDLPLHVTEILRTRDDVLAQYHRQFRFILVDEYQDTNLVQYLWLRLLAQRPDGSPNLCCVGDDDQSIYSWRGAEVENILRFEKDFPGANIVRLESNYRSTAPILAAASALIAHNGGRLGKTLRPGRNDSSGEKLRVASVWDSDEEARAVGERIEELQRAGDSLAEMAILVRGGVPDAGVRGAADHAGVALPGGGRAAVLRAGGNTRRDRVYACAGLAFGRSGLRADHHLPRRGVARRRCRRCIQRRASSGCR